MKPAPHDYVRATSVQEAVALLAEAGEDAKVLAGGQSLVPMLSFRLSRPSVLVDVGRIAELRHVRREPDGALTLGALTTHRRIELGAGSTEFAGLDVLPRAAGLIGHHPIRTRGTIGGSLAHADPSAEWCVLAVLLDAVIAATGPAGAREWGAADFLQDYFTTALSPDEVVTEVRFPRPAPRAVLLEHAPRKGDFAVVLAGVDADLDPRGRIVSPRVVLGGVGGVPVRCQGAEAVLDGAEPTAAVFREAARVAAGEVDAADDAHATASYRRRLAAVLVDRALALSLSPTEVGR